MDDDQQTGAGEATCSSTAYAETSARPPGEPTEPLSPGTRVAHYELREVVGRGCMGIVYAAHDHKLDRTVAIKTLLDRGDASLRTRLLREAKAMARLSHDNVVRIHEIGEAEGA
ncbi:MAG: protein kinase, partial [Myxococcales bacterium]|nr:protein kinase [Myxococcales bacterium]